VLGGSSGWGVWLTIVASAGLAATAVAGAVGRLGARSSPSMT